MSRPRRVATPAGGPVPSVPGFIIVAWAIALAGVAAPRFAGVPGAAAGEAAPEEAPDRAPGRPVPLRRAHAHNDYRHERPLLDALARGFTSVEADVFPVEGELRVGHDRSELRPGRTLRSLYLEPLRERVRRRGGRVHRDGPGFTLLVDFKTDGRRTWRLLHRRLAEYRGILTAFRRGEVETGPVTVVVSGDRPWKAIEETSPRWAGVDGRLSDLGSGRSPSLMPLVSDRWTSHFRWRGEGPFPPEERAKLRRIVQAAHDAGWRVRFWATPERPVVWRELLAADVDLINTDDLDGLRDFLLEAGDPARRSGEDGDGDGDAEGDVSGAGEDGESSGTGGRAR